MAKAPSASQTKTLFGHPLGLMNLFFTEAFERFSYYGLRAMLILYLGDAVINHRGGLALDDKQAAGIYALYVGFVYLLALVCLFQTTSYSGRYARSISLLRGKSGRYFL